MHQLIKYFKADPMCDYSRGDKGIVDLGNGLVGYLAGDFKGKAVIYCHGNGEICTSSKVSLFDRLVAEGITVLSVEYRGYGLSTGNFSEEGIHEAARAGFEYVRNHGVSSKDITILGYSLGSAPAIRLAAECAVGGLILQTPFTDAASVAKFLLPIVPIKASDYDVLANIKVAHAVRCPVMVMHGTADCIVPYVQACELFSKLESSNDRRFVTVPGGGHCNFQQRMGIERYYRTITEFIKGNGR